MPDLFRDERTHALKALTVTNSDNIVPTCACGWIGSVHVSYRKHLPSGRLGRVEFDGARQNAKLEHLRHARG